MPRSAPSGYELTRESVLNGSVRAFLAAADPTLQLTTPEENRASIRAMLDQRPDGGGDVWLFAYGSLIWNPMIHFAERRVVTVRGYHRRFCLWSHIGRGSQATPGLTLGLERGGVCRGVAYRIAAAEAQQELEIVWGREMITGAYCPRWVRMTTLSPPETGWAIAFVINRGHARYAGMLPEEKVASVIAGARGPLGACATYLFNTTAHLAKLGIPDRHLERLRNRVAEELRRLKVEPK